jgi:hypothetical protein
MIVLTLLSCRRAILGIRNMVAGNADAQAVLAQLEQRGIEVDKALAEMGMDVAIDDATGRLRVTKATPSPPAP